MTSPVTYAHTTLGALDQQLANRLGDSVGTFWTQAERLRWIKEALRTFGAHSTYWRNRGVFQTVANAPFYDITSVNAQMQALLAYTITDQDLVAEIQFHLMEPSTGNSWTGTDQFTLNDVTNAIQRRRDQFLSETGAVLTRLVTPFPLSPSGRIPLADNVIDVRRVAWEDVNNNVTPLFRTDELQLGYGYAGWDNNPDLPTLYSTVVSPPLSLQIAAVPSQPGSVDVLSVNSGAALNPAAGVVLGIPDDFAWVVKWGALADLLSMDGQSRDPDRARYCEERWKQGVELARINPSVIYAQIQGVDNMIDSLWALDSVLPNWQTQSAAAQPTIVATAGQNIVALANMPNGVYSVTLDVVQNSPVPTALGSFVQVGREILDVIIDYAEHLCMFKCQGAEFKATFQNAENLIRQAGIYNDKLKASALFKDILWPNAQRYKYDVPRRIPEAVNG